VFLINLALPMTLRGQVVELLLRESTNERPVGGAIVRLLEGSVEVSRGLSDEIGRLSLRVSRKGVYRLKIDRIGYASFFTETFSIGSDEVIQKRIGLPSNIVHLPEIRTISATQCTSTGVQGTVATALWTEVQKALTANVMTLEQRVPLHVREFVRELDVDATPLREWVELSRVSIQPPFGSLPPAALLKTGFVYEMADSAVFAAPDAALLLSKEFVLSHCFFPKTGSDGVAGLGFRPLNSRRRTDVTGTLWVDQNSSELKWLEYEYTGLPAGLGASRLGGRVDFTRTPGGRWIISYWHIRMPRVQTRVVEVQLRSKEITDIVGYTDRGGRVEVAGDTAGVVYRAILSGQVYDSTKNIGLAGAVVWVVGSADTIRTDSAGRFQLALALSGPRIVEARHPNLVALGGPAKLETILSLGDTSFVRFSSPSLSTLVKAFCLNANRPGRVSIVGLVRRKDGAPADRHQVRAFHRRNRTNVPIPDTRPTSTTASGAFGLCNLPSSDTVLVTVANGKETVVELPVITGKRSGWVDIREWGTPDSAVRSFVTSAADLTPTSMHQGSTDRARVHGMVYDSLTRGPLSGAIITVSGRKDSTITDSIGRFDFSVTTMGWQILAVALPQGEDLRGERTRSISIAPGDSLEVPISVIPVRRFVEGRCGVGKSSPGIVGLVLGKDGLPQKGIELRAIWVTNRRYERRTTSGASGDFALCDLPFDLPGGNSITLEVTFDDGLIRQQPVVLQRNEFRWLDIRPKD
jgi:hypothetical protein